MIPVVTVEQMRAVEQQAFAHGSTEEELSDRAAAAVHRRVLELLPGGGNVVVLAGPGNNGLDAVKVHRLLTTVGATSSLYCWKRTDCAGRLDEFGSALEQADLVLDGLFGIGLDRPLEAEARHLVEMINTTGSRSDGPTVLALDVPSGLNANTGEVMGVAVEADVTVTLGLPKIGLYTGDGPAHVGRVIVEGIGLEPVPEAPYDVYGFTGSDPVMLPARRIGSHKNDNGRVLVIGGSLNYPGAPVLVALAAQRVGAGYVTVAFPRSMLTAIASHLLEQTLLPLPEADTGTLGRSAIEDASEGVDSYRAVVLGNGLGRDDETIAFVLGLVGLQASRERGGVGFLTSTSRSDVTERQMPPTVVDGDGLFALSTREAWWDETSAISLLTPHPGEMARLVGKEVHEVEANRLGTALDAARRWQRTVLLKGAYPVVATPDGTTRILIDAHPELGTAGTGDVLAGVCGFLLSLGLDPLEAATSALILGGRAATLASNRVGIACVKAGDVIEELPGARADRS